MAKFNQDVCADRSLFALALVAAYSSDNQYADEILIIHIDIPKILLSFSHNGYSVVDRNRDR